MHLARNLREWPVSIVCPDIEDVFRQPTNTPTATKEAAAEQKLMQALSEDYDKSLTPDSQIAARPWYGRCVYEADNNVCDDQIVTLTWDDHEEVPAVQQEQEQEHEQGERNLLPPKRLAKTATFHMIAPTEKQCQRRGIIYGTTGELTYDSRTISVYNFEDASTTTIPVPRRPPQEEKSHGGGDYGLARAFVAAVLAVEKGELSVDDAQARFVGCTLEEAVRSHAVVFAAEEARREEKVVRWLDWWDQKIRLSTAAAEAGDI